jgi:6,7-dimethyl-8-ribityllumazine synthase
MAGRAPRHRAGYPDVLSARARFAILAARFNEPISKKLADGALAALTAHGVATEAIEVHWVPGSFELPLAAQALARTGRFAAIVCVGVVIRGATPHFEHVSREAATGIRQAALTTGVPVTFGLITALDEQQAWERAGGSVGNRGEEAALAALEMAGFLARLRSRSGGKRGSGRRGTRGG